MTRPSTGWMAESSCSSLDPAEAHEIFYGLEVSKGGVRAKALCAACPVLEECRAYFDAVEPDARDCLFGIVAGEFAGQRHARRRAARGAAA